MIPSADLPLNRRGAVYHLNLKPEELANTIITVGDPARVKQVSKFFDSIEVKRMNREFVTHTGYVGTHRLSVISTGIGMPNLDIVMNELDALVNIDLKTRTVNQDKKQLTIIRLGTTGGLIPECVPGDVMISRYAIGFDSLIHYYKNQYSPLVELLKKQLTDHLEGYSGPFYLAESCSKLAPRFEKLGLTGITATCGGFYGPQGRQLRLPLQYPHFIDRLRGFHAQNYSIINLEMETAAMYALGSLLGHSCLSISVVLANRVSGTFAKQIKSSLDVLIGNSLQIINDLLVS